MSLLDLRGVAERLGVNYDTVRKYATNKTRYPGFPKKKACEHCGGVGSGYDPDEVDDWSQSRPGAGGGQHRQDSRAAGLKAWETRRANPVD